METMSLKFSRIGLFLAAAMLATPRIYAGQYFQDFHAFAVGATNFNDGSQLFSTDLGTLVGAQAGQSPGIGVDRSQFKQRAECV